MLVAVLSLCGSYLLSTSLAPAQVDWTWHDSGVSEDLNDVIWDGDRFLAVGGSGTMITSPDGETWSAVASGTGETLRSVVRGGDKLVAVGRGGTILSSSDGTSWSQQVSGVSTYVSGVAYGSGRFVAVGGSGTILSSTDGVAWLPAESGTVKFLQSVHYADGVFVAVGASGTIRTSADGMTWAGAPTGRSEFLSGVHYHEGTWLAGGQSGLILTSADAQEWHPELIGPYAWVRGFVSAGDRVIAVGEAGTVLISFDMQTWQVRKLLPVGVEAALTASAFVGGEFLIVGEVALFGPAASPSALAATSPLASAIRWGETVVSVAEDGGELELELQRSPAGAGELEVDLSVVSGEALQGEDFTEPDPVAVFEAGSDTATVTISILNNPEPELPESFGLEMNLPISSANSLIIVPPSTLQVTIIDAQDRDTDGLLDSWEIEHFGDIESYSAFDDPDGDHNNNGRERDDGTDPSDASSASYFLKVFVAGQSGEVERSPLAQSYSKGESVNLSAVAAPGSQFAGWGGDATGALPQLEVLMDQDRSVEASFSLPYDEVLDTVGKGLEWSASALGGGARWLGLAGQGNDDFIDAAIAAGGQPGELAFLEASVWGPADIGFRWKLDPVPGARLMVSVGGESLASYPAAEGGGWTWQFVSIPPGLQHVRWTYVAGSGADSGSGLAGVDQVFVDQSYFVWAATYFNQEELRDPEISGESADADGEGLPNVLEYLLDTDPTRPSWSDWRAPEFSLAEVDGVATPQILLRRVAHRQPELQIEVLWSGDLSEDSWLSLGTGDPLFSGGFIDTLLYSDHEGAGAGRRYYRLQVVEPE